MPDDDIKINLAASQYGASLGTAGVNASYSGKAGSLGVYVGATTDYTDGFNIFLSDLNLTSANYINTEHFKVSSGVRTRLTIDGDDNTSVQFRGKVVNLNFPINDVWSLYLTQHVDAKYKFDNNNWEYKAGIYAGGKVKVLQNSLLLPKGAEVWLEGQPTRQIGGKNDGKLGFAVNGGLNIPIN